MIHTMAIITGDVRSYPEVGRVSGPSMVALMVIFTISFGIRRLSPTERHATMMVPLVAECIVKLAAFLVCA
jgi:hypothetical protein